MKKLRKLTLNEMQDFAPLSPREQMSMKGGNWGSFFRMIPFAWEASKSIYNYLTGSGSTSSGCACPENYTAIHGADSVRMGNGAMVYGSQLICIP